MPHEVRAPLEANAEKEQQRNNSHSFCSPFLPPLYVGKGNFSPVQKKFQRMQNSRTDTGFGVRISKQMALLIIH